MEEELGIFSSPRAFIQGESYEVNDLMVDTLNQSVSRTLKVVEKKHFSSISQVHQPPLALDCNSALNQRKVFTIGSFPLYDESLLTSLLSSRSNTGGEPRNLTKSQSL